MLGQNIISNKIKSIITLKQYLNSLSGSSFLFSESDLMTLDGGNNCSEVDDLQGVTNLSQTTGSYQPNYSSNTLVFNNDILQDTSGVLRYRSDLKISGKFSVTSLSINQCIVADWTTTGDQRSYLFYLTSGGALLFYTSTNGTSSGSSYATIKTGVQVSDVFIYTIERIGSSFFITINNETPIEWVSPSINTANGSNIGIGTTNFPLYGRYVYLVVSNDVDHSKLLDYD